MKLRLTYSSDFIRSVVHIHNALSRFSVKLSVNSDIAKTLITYHLSFVGELELSSTHGQV